MKNLINLQQLLLLIFFILYINNKYNNIVELEQQRNLDCCFFGSVNNKS